MATSSYRKNKKTMATSQLKITKEESDAKQGQGFLYVKVSMDGCALSEESQPQDLQQLQGTVFGLGLEKMFVGFSTGRSGPNGLKGKDSASESRNNGEFVLTYEDKDGGCWLVMFYGNKYTDLISLE